MSKFGGEFAEHNKEHTFSFFFCPVRLLRQIDYKTLTKHVVLFFLNIIIMLSSCKFRCSCGVAGRKDFLAMQIILMRALLERITVAVVKLMLGARFEGSTVIVLVAVVMLFEKCYLVENHVTYSLANNRYSYYFLESCCLLNRSY